MSEQHIVSLTIEINIQVPDEDLGLLDYIAEAAMQGAVDSISNRSPTGTGFNYNYAHKKSRRGMTVSPKTLLGVQT